MLIIKLYLRCFKWCIFVDISRVLWQFIEDHPCQQYTIDYLEMISNQAISLVGRRYPPLQQNMVFTNSSPMTWPLVKRDVWRTINNTWTKLPKNGSREKNLCSDWLKSWPSLWCNFRLCSQLDLKGFYLLKENLIRFFFLKCFDVEGYLSIKKRGYFGWCETCFKLLTRRRKGDNEVVSTISSQCWLGLYWPFLAF